MVWKRAVIVVGILAEVIVAYPYANGYPYSSSPVLAAVVGTKVTVGGSAAKGVTGGVKDLRDFHRDHVFEGGDKINSAADAVRYHALDNVVNGHRVADSSKGGSVDKVKHLAGENFEADKSHNRKQIKSGFSNSYHKDENGSKSSYYEDSDDRGGKQVYDNRHNLRNNYNDHLYNKELRNDQLRDRYDDRFGGVDLRGRGDLHHQAATDRGNLHDYRDGFHADRDYDQRSYHHEEQLPPLVPVRNYDELFQRKSFYEPRPMFATAPRAPITVYEDPREYAYRDEYHYSRPRPEGRVVAEDGFMRRFDQDFGDRTRIIFRPSPLLNYRRY
ncbi:uncharacterized protein LOC120420248 [Culex pipiens pallens]|uniref:uncharacterized protein LOC120420248 n=1 Tax=Culex pipiens pallens TaxID=42434 RepID=UPI00195355B3|nr:uncharacterized protein LOC120420248 [Culex pipiens pallens]